MDSIATYLNSVAIEIYSVETELKSPVTEINPFTTDKLSDKHLACHLKMLHFYLGNLNYRVKEGDLERALAVYGTVHSVKIIKDRETGKSKGFGFVEMDDEAASQAIKELSGSDFMGRQMVIKEALPKA